MTKILAGGTYRLAEFDKNWSDRIQMLLMRATQNHEELNHSRPSPRARLIAIIATEVSRWRAFGIEIGYFAPADVWPPTHALDKRDQYLVEAILSTEIDMTVDPASFQIAVTHARATLTPDTCSFLMTTLFVEDVDFYLSCDVVERILLGGRVQEIGSLMETTPWVTHLVAMDAIIDAELDAAATNIVWPAFWRAGDLRALSTLDDRARDRLRHLESIRQLLTRVTQEEESAIPVGGTDPFHQIAHGGHASAAPIKLVTCGSVDVGKSTLIGRLLFDTKMIPEDQLHEMDRASLKRGQDYTDLALLTDGLRSERDQGITIDVAHRYFSTSQRKFIVADAPGHVQYTRNMVTGASNADVAIILVDARTGALEQSRRHALIASLLGVPRLIVCVNKMDLVDFSEVRYQEVREEFREFAAELDIADLSFIPISALTGDNVVARSAAMPWFEGAPLLRYLEEIRVRADGRLMDLRFPIQYVVEPDDLGTTEFRGSRGYAGTIAGGVMRIGDSVTVLPSGFETHIEGIWARGDKSVGEAIAGQAVTIVLEDDLDVSRGDLVCRPHSRPHVGRDLDSTICWLGDECDLTVGSRFKLHQNTRATEAIILALDYRLDVNSRRHHEGVRALKLNEIGRVRLRTEDPLSFDPYGRSRETGGFILINEATNNTVGAGMIIGPNEKASSVSGHGGSVRRHERATQGMTVWFTGLPSAGKSSVAAELERRLVASGRPAYVLDAGDLRQRLDVDLSFSSADRAEHIRRAGEVAMLVADMGVIAIVSLVSPYAQDRERVRASHADVGLPFAEIFVDTPLDLCESRDTFGMYAKARAGKIKHFTGLDDPYERPRSPHLRLRPGDGSPAQQAALVLKLVERLIV